MSYFRHDARLEPPHEYRGLDSESGFVNRWMSKFRSHALSPLPEQWSQPRFPRTENEESSPWNYLSTTGAGRSRSESMVSNQDREAPPPFWQTLANIFVATRMITIFLLVFYGIHLIYLSFLFYAVKVENAYYRDRIFSNMMTPQNGLALVLYHLLRNILFWFQVSYSLSKYFQYSPSKLTIYIALGLLNATLDIILYSAEAVFEKSGLLLFFGLSNYFVCLLVIGMVYTMFYYGADWDTVYPAGVRP